MASLPSGAARLSKPRAPLVAADSTRRRVPTMARDRARASTRAASKEQALQCRLHVTEAQHTPVPWHRPARIDTRDFACPGEGALLLACPSPMSSPQNRRRLDLPVERKVYSCVGSVTTHRRFWERTPPWTNHPNRRRLSRGCRVVAHQRNGHPFVPGSSCMNSACRAWLRLRETRRWWMP